MFFGLVMQEEYIFATIFNPCMLKHAHYVTECLVDLHENSMVKI